jgi:preprotein translocase subunit YajC
MFTTLLFAAETAVPAAGAAPGQPSMIASFLPLVLIFVVFYFMFIMPQRKEQKKLKEMMASLKVGDKVVTNAGIVGTISKILEKDDILAIKCGENTTINVIRAYVSRKIEKEDASSVQAEEPKK